MLLFQKLLLTLDCVAQGVPGSTNRTETGHDGDRFLSFSFKDVGPILTIQMFILLSNFLW